jgi:UDP:flavonoid glycosyltransferase YjiC (YdhE family)
MFEGQFSPQLVLALFSQLLASPQKDWPANTVLTGFPFYDRRGEPEGLSADLEAFLSAGPAPIVFTLGSSAVMDAGAFYSESAEAAKRLGMRAVLLVGRDPRNRPAVVPEGVSVFEYAPFSLLLPRAVVTVHQGGVGTTGQAMRSGRPMLVVPFAFDQPDNATRVTRLGVARTLARHRYTAANVAREIKALLSDPHYNTRAEEVGLGCAQKLAPAPRAMLLNSYLNRAVSLNSEDSYYIVAPKLTTMPRAGLIGL